MISHSNKYSISVVMVMIILLQLLFPAIITETYAGDFDPLSITVSADKNTLKTGEEYIYSVNFSVRDVKKSYQNVYIKTTLPDEVEYQSYAANNQVKSAIYNQQDNSLTIKVANHEDGITLKAGSTGHLEINAKIKEDATCSGTSISHDFTIEADEVDPPITSDSIDIDIETIPVEDSWKISKHANGSNHLPGSNIRYTIRLEEKDSSIGRVGLKDVRITDELPAEAVLVSATAGYGYDTVAREVYWDVGDVDVTETPTFNITLNYPEANVSVDDTVTNKAKVTGGKTCDITDTFSDIVSVATTFVGPIAPSEGTIGFSKSKTYEFRYIGQNQTYTISNIRNTGNILVNNFIVEDLGLSDKLDYTTIGPPSNAQPEDYTFMYELNNSGSWNTYTDPDGGDIIVSDFVDDSNSLTGIRFDFGTVEPGYNAGNIRIIGTVNSSANHGDTIENTANLSFDYLDEDASINQVSINNSAQFTINSPKPWLEPTKNHNKNISYLPGDTVTFTLNIKNKDGATGVYTNPIVYDLLPENFEYEDGTISLDWHTYGQTNPAPTVAQSVYEDFNGTGRTLIKWIWSDYDLPIGEDIEITYNAKINDYTKPSKTLPEDEEYWNELFITTNVNPEFWWGDYKDNNNWDNKDSIKDSNDGVYKFNFDQNDGNDEYLVRAQNPVIVNEIASVVATKWNRGVVDINETDNPEDAWKKYPQVGKTVQGGTADYKLEIFNEGNTNIKRVEILDILPYINDTAVLTSQIRDSKWRPNLIGEIDTSNLGVSSATVDIYYSKSSDKNYVNLDYDKTDTNYWIKDIPDNFDKSSIQSIYIDIKDINNSEGLNPGETIVLTWKMRAPVGTPIGPQEETTAWNSMGVRTTTIHNTVLDDAEPNMVGFQTVKDNEGQIGNFVWFDSNGDGIQNDGHDDQEAGINGITVKLFDASSNEMLDETVTANDHDGKPGYYLFPGLSSSDLSDKTYYLEFEIPDYYEPTTKDSSQSDANDSDAALDEDKIKTDDINLNYDSDLGRLYRNLDIDLGLVYKTVDGKASMAVTKEAITFKNSSGDIIYDTDGVTPLNPGLVSEGERAVNKDETIVYEMEVNNDGSVPLHNIKIQDEMDRDQAGFVFTQLGFDKDNLLSIDESPIVANSLYNSETETTPNIVVDEIGVGETLYLRGEYTVVDDDIDGSTLDNDVKVWANEINGDGKSDPVTDNASVDLAKLRLEKAVSQIDKGSTGSFVTYDPDNHAVEVGDTVRYAITAYNDSSIDLTDVKLNDAKIGLTNYNIATIARGESVVVEDSNTDYIVQESDLPGPLTNTVTATDDDIRNTVSATSTENLSDLTVIKSVEKIDNKTSNGAIKYSGEYFAEVGDEIIFAIDFQNTGTADLEGVTITEEILTSESGTVSLAVYEDEDCQTTFGLSDISSGSTKTVYAKYTVQQSDIEANPDPDNDTITDTIINTVKAKSNKTIVEEDSVDVEIADIEITKEATSGTGPYKVGDEINYDITITNKGSIRFTNINVNDPMISSITNNSITLNPGRSTTISGKYTVQSSDLLSDGDTNPDNAKINNTVTASHSKLSSNKTATVIVDTKGIEITKTGIKRVVDKILAVDDFVDYTIVVKNIGSTDLNNVIISDPMLGINVANISIDAGNTDTITEPYQVKASDLPGPIINTATADAGDGVTDSDIHYLGEPKIDIQKNVILGKDQTSYISNNHETVLNSNEVSGVNGTDITYVFTVTNIGDTYLDNITITDPQLGIDQDNQDRLTLITELSDDKNETVISNIYLAGKDEVELSEKLVFYYETKINGNMNNEAIASGNPVTSEGEDIPNATNPEDKDTADVYTLASIGDYVWLNANNDKVQDTEESGIFYVKLNLYHANDEDAVYKSVYTNPDGKYEFTNLKSGSYTVKIDELTLPQGVIANYDKDLDNDSIVRNIEINSDGDDVEDIDFGYNHTGSIGDTVWYDYDEDGIIDPGEGGISGVTLRLVDTDTDQQVGEDFTTAGDGKYSFNNLPEGNYRVDIVSVPAGIEQVYSPYIAIYTNNIIALNPGQNISNVDFGYNFASAIGDTVWYDFNEDGNQLNEKDEIDSDIPYYGDEIGIQGVKLKLYSSTDNYITVIDYVYTDADGKYLFTDLDAGTYKVQVDSTTLTAGLEQVADPDSTLNHESTVTIGDSEQNLTMDFGYNHTGSIGDLVWYDMYKDNNKDASEAGADNVTVILRDNSGAEIRRTQTVNGYYTFNKLKAGNYIVEVDKDSSSSLDGYSAGYDLDGGSDNAAAVSIVTGQDKIDVDFGYDPIPHLSIDKTADISNVKVGDLVTYTITLTNDGTTVLNNVYLQDDMLNLNTNIGNLDTVSNSVYQTSKTHEITQVDVDNAVNDKITNTAWTWSDETPIKVHDDHVLNLNTNPVLEVIKIASKTPARIGDTIKYTILATNKGDITLHNLVLSDDKIDLSTVDTDLGDLTVGESVYRTVEYTIDSDDPKPLINVAQVMSDETGTVNSNQCKVDINNPILEVNKSVSADTVGIGETIDYLVTVTNNGNTVIEDVYLNDDFLNIQDLYIGDLDVGDSQEYELGSYTVSEGDWNWDSTSLITNTVDVTGTVSETVYSYVYGEGTVIEEVYSSIGPESSQVKTIVIANPNLQFTKEANKETAEIGDTITYTLKITNKGDVTLTNVNVIDDMLGINETIPSFEVNDTKTFTGTYKVTEADEDSRKVMNTATASSQETGSIEKIVEVTIPNDTPTGGGGSPGGGGGSGGGGGTTPPPEEPEETPPEEEPQPPVEEPIPPEEPVPPVEEPEVPLEEPQPEQPVDEPEVPGEEQPEEPTEDQDQKQTYEETPVSGKVEVPEGGNSEISEEPQNGKLTIDEDGNWKYEPNPGFIGKDKFKVKVVDENGNEEEIIIEIDVEEIPAGAASALPKTGESSKLWFYIIGLLFIITGGYFSKNNRRKI